MNFCHLSKGQYSAINQIRLQVVNETTFKIPVILNFELIFLLIAQIKPAYFKITNKIANSEIQNILGLGFQN